MGKYIKLLAVILAIIITLSSGIAWLNRDMIIENDNFFTLSIGEVPEVDARYWSLQITGLVETPLSLNLSEIMAMPKVVQISTIKCVEGPFGTAEWGGVPLSHVLELAGANPADYDVIFRSVDGFTTSLTLEDATDDGVLLAYEMNGEVLPADQGYPLRLVAPEKYGYKWAKWISEIEIVEYDHLGFWESRGWDDDATISRFSDWGWHAVGLTFAAVLCGIAAVSGFKFDEAENFWTDLPDFVSVRFHMWVSAAYFLVASPVFGLWAWTTLQNRGGVFYSGHGTLGLTVFILTLVSTVSGVLAMKFSRKWRRPHLAVSALCFFILVGTVLSGIWLIIGT